MADRWRKLGRRGSACARRRCRPGSRPAESSATIRLQHDILPLATIGSNHGESVEAGWAREEGEGRERARRHEQRHPSNSAAHQTRDPRVTRPGRRAPWAPRTRPTSTAPVPRSPSSRPYRIYNGTPHVWRAFRLAPSSVRHARPSSRLDTNPTSTKMKAVFALLALVGAAAAQSSSAAAPTSTAGIDPCILTCVQSAASSAGCSSLYVTFLSSRP